MKILLPVDLIQPIEPTIDMLKATVNLSQCEVRLLYVRELLPAYENVIKTSGSFVDDWEKKVEAKAQECLDVMQEKLKGQVVRVTTEIASGPPASTICNVAQDEGQDIVVVSPRTKPITERLFFGSVSSRVVDRAPTSILVARPIRQDDMKNVVIGYDGSENSRYAVERAITMFKLSASKAKITVVHSVDVAEPVKFLSPVEFVAAIEQNLLMAGETYLAQAEKVLADGQVRNVDCCLIEGDPAAGILKIAQDLSADLVLIGSKGHGSITDFLLGSVSHKVSMHAHCPVAVIKKGPDANA